MKRVIIYIFFFLLVLISGCNSFILGPKNSSILLSDKNLPNGFDYAFPFNATSKINDSIYDKIANSPVQAKSYSEKYVLMGIEELRHKYQLSGWDTQTVSCKRDSTGSFCRIEAKSGWSDIISKENGNHFTDQIILLDPNYRPHFNYRFRINIIVKIYVDEITKLVHYDTMLFLTVQRKSSYASEKAFDLNGKVLKSINKSAADNLENTINGILYNYYLEWIKSINEAGK